MEQYVISILSLTSIGLAYWPGKDLRLYGAIAGLGAQPFWLYMIFERGLWGIAPLTPAYTLMYLVAFKAHWNRSKAQG